MMLFNFALAAALLVASSPAGGDGMPVVTVSAVPSKFTPAKITLHRGVATVLKFQTEGVHAIESSELGIPKTTLLPGETTVVVDPKQTGTYVLHCEIYCGEDHEHMMLTIVVEE